MNPGRDAIEALATVPGWDPRDSRIETLNGGLTNRVYHVRSKDRECVLRIDVEAPGVVVPDRRCELTIMASAAAAGVAPAILHADPEAGILVTEYLHGRAWEQTDLEGAENLEALAGLLRRVHDLPECGFAIDLEQFAQKYEERLRRRDGLHDFALHCVKIVREHPVQADLACCHNDVVAKNVIDAGGLHLIDWEYACDNDPFFDLASVIGFHDLDGKRQHILLSAYAGGADAETSERLAGQLRLFDAVQWLWLATRQLASPSREQAKRLDQLQRRIR